VSAAWSLTVGGVSNPRPLVEPSRLGTDTEIGGPGDSVYASVKNAVVVGARSSRTTGITLGGGILKNIKLFH
jgi:hypothetical protein